MSLINKMSLLLSLFMGLLIFSFQNCSQVDFTSISAQMDGLGGDNEGDVKPPIDNCLVQPDLCDPKIPYVEKAGVVTILLALGDQFENDLVIANESSQLIAEDMVKYASPKLSPKILVVRDFRHKGESLYDFTYISEVLLSRYDVTTLQEPKEGLDINDLEGYDLIWFNNPGYPMSNKKTYRTLLAFNGGVVLSGDDLTRGEGFNTERLTGLRHKNNGTSVKCDGTSYSFDNNLGEQYGVSLSAKEFPGVASDILNFHYGNDIDDSEPSNVIDNSRQFEVLANANVKIGNCSLQRPVIVRYEK